MTTFPYPFLRTSSSAVGDLDAELAPCACQKDSLDGPRIKAEASRSSPRSLSTSRRSYVRRLRQLRDAAALLPFSGLDGKSSIGALRFVDRLGELLRAMPGARGVDNFLFWDRRQ
jgi:hypothetical protein